MDAPNSFPENAKRAYKGKIFEVWEWEQEMFDGSTEVFEGLKRPDTVEVIAVVGDKILIEDQEQPGREPFICPPGGRVDEGEESLEAIKRELLEETGYESDDWTLFDTQHPWGKMEWTIYTYIAHDCKKTHEPHLDAGEKITTRLVDFEEFLMLSEEPSLRGRELIELMLRLRLDPQKKAEFKEMLFGSEHA